MNEEQLIELMGLHLQVFFGDHSAEKAFEVGKYLFEQMPKFECKIYYKGGRDEMIERVLLKWNEKKGKSRQEARLEFIDIISAKDSFGRNFYVVKIDQATSDIKDLKDQMIMALGKTNLRLMTMKYVSPEMLTRR